ncbi:MAG: hypothetical protein Q8M39_03100 [Sulfuricurvum sp.]|nr:hypothetical protein [Sulfuricurvum sp.]
MNDDMNGFKNTMDQCTSISIIDRQKSIKWLAKQNDLIVYEVFKLQKKHFHRFKSGHPNENPILMAQVSFFEALREYISDLEDMNRKNRSTNFGYLKKVSKNRAKQFRKARLSPKHEKLLNLQNVILNLRDVEGYSSRDVSAYLLKIHNFEISHTEILKFEKLMKKGKEHDDSNS